MKKQTSRISKYLLTLVLALIMVLGAGKAMDVQAAEGDPVKLDFKIASLDSRTDGWDILEDDLKPLEGSAENKVTLHYNNDSSWDSDSSYPPVACTIDTVKVCSGANAIKVSNPKKVTYYWPVSGNGAGVKPKNFNASGSTTAAYLYFQDAEELTYCFQYRNADNTSIVEYRAIKFVKKTAEEEVSEVSNLIDAIDLNNIDASQINAAVTAVSIITDERQAMISEERQAKLALAEKILNVINKINAIGEVTLDSNAAIEAARTAYDALDAETERPYITEKVYSILTAAETAYDLAEAQKISDLVNDIELDNIDASKITKATVAYVLLTDDQKALVSEESMAKLDLAKRILGVINKINSIKIDEVTLDSKDVIEAARDAYDALDADTEQQYITTDTYKILAAAEKIYAELKDEADEAAVEDAMNKIQAIDDEVSLDSKANIDEARAAFDALTDDQKAIFKLKDDTGNVIEILTKAEAKYKELKAAADKAAADKAAADKAAAEKAAAEKAAAEKAAAEKAAAEKAAAEKKAATPAKVESLKVKKVSSKKVTISWKKVKGCSGYEVVMRTGKKGSFKVIKTVKGAKKVTINKAGLKKNKSYTFKVRAYTTLKGEKIYGAYSAAKTVKMK